MSGEARTIGLWGAVATLVGYVIGASIFVLPAELLPSTGAGVLVAYALAAVPAVFTCVAGAVLANVFPVSGASYVAVRETLGPRPAFVAAWLILVAGALGAALVAYGFADYVTYFAPGVSPRAVALATVAAFVALNLTPVSVTVGVQGAMVVYFAIVLVGFAVAGIATGDPARAAPLLPHGWSPVLAGAVAAYFSYAGLQVLIEIGGEIVDPGRTIPRALAIAFTSILALYLLFVLAVVMLAEPAGGTPATALVGRLAELRFGAWVARALVVSALLAAATSVNGVVFTQSRDVRALALDGRLPAALASAPGGVPRAAVLALGAAALAATAAGASIRAYAVLTAMCMMAVQGALGLAVLRVPRRAAEAWRRSAFRLGPVALACCGWGLVLVSAAFFALAALQAPGNLAWFAAVTLAGIATYAAQGRRRP